MSRRFYTVYGTTFFLEPTRAKRLRKKENAYRRAVKYLQRDYWYQQHPEMLIEHAKRRADNFKVCSCHMCGNPRRSLWVSSEERMTMGERKAWVDMEQQYEEYGIRLPKKRTGGPHGR